ncbi:MAG: M23 family metallopeptidase [Clostridia bacterium]|nr:M23 family metallopeptidase [Clostridia bacterium]
MVVHDEVRIQEWTQALEEKQEKEKRRPTFHVSVIAVQSVACCVVVLLALLLRMAGGEAYASLRRSFQQALARNEWVSAVAKAWDGDPIEKTAKAEDNDVKEDAFTDEDSAPLAGSSVAVAALAPLESGTLTSGYGDRIHPINGSKEFHTGVDIAAPLGASLLASYDGEVAEVGENDLLGKFVRLSHGDGIEILYGHCSEVVARQGDAIKAGEQVALVGSTGVSTGSHVHIRVSVDGVTCDPAVLLPIGRYA